jgi:hypothetical protein
MPEIDLIQVPLYSPLFPYFWTYDNLPLQAIIERENLINDAVDINSDILRQAAGTQGTLATRLNRSIDQDGNLIPTAIDYALHNIGAHTDGPYLGTEYVRMELTERNKLEFIAREATNMRLEFETISVTNIFDEGPVIFENSESVTWELLDFNRVQAHITVPFTAIFQPNYDITPAYQNPFSPDYQSYQTTSLPTLFIDGSLRLFVNGVRLTETAVVPVPRVDPSLPLLLLSYSSDSSTGLFVLTSAIAASDVIRIDFDTQL